MAVTLLCVIRWCLGSETEWECKNFCVVIIQNGHIVSLSMKQSERSKASKSSCKNPTVTRSCYLWNRAKSKSQWNQLQYIQTIHTVSNPLNRAKKTASKSISCAKNPKWTISLVYHETKQVWSYVEGPWAGQPLNTWDERQNPKWQMRYDQGIVYAREYMNSGLGRHTVIWWWKRIASPFPCRKPWLCKESGVLELQELAAEQFGD